MKSAVNSAPAATITPPSSWPSVNGHGSGFGQWPLRMCWSVPQTPQAPILISAAFLGTAGHGTVRITGGAPGTSEGATRMEALGKSISGCHPGQPEGLIRDPYTTTLTMSFRFRKDGSRLAPRSPPHFLGEHRRILPP